MMTVSVNRPTLGRCLPWRITTNAVLDFQDLLIAKLRGETYDPPETPIFTVGSSGELIYGRISADDSYGFIHNRMRNLRGNLPRADARQLNRSFQDYMDYIETLHP